MFKKLFIMVLMLGLLFSMVGFAQAAEVEDLEIGYVVNFMSHEWYQNVTDGAKRKADELGLELEIADADNSVSEQVNAAENMIAKGVDVLALTPVDAKALLPVVMQAEQAGIPVVTESNPVEGAETVVGNDNKAGGKRAGRWFVEYAKENNLDPKILIIGYPNFRDCRLRVEGFKESLEESDLEYEIVQEVDGGGLKEEALEVATDALTANSDINVIYGINDDSTTGGMAAYRAAGLDEDELTAVSYGFEGEVGREALLGDTPYEAAVGMFPNYVGACLIDAAVKASQGEELPDRYETPTTMITEETFAEYYTKIDDDDYEMNFERLDELREEFK